MKVAIVGSRDYPRLDWVWDFVTKLAARRPDTVIISGGARGVDTVAAVAARAAGLHVIELIPEWERLGRYLAPFARNSQIVDEADAVVAFWDQESKGTKDTIDKALAAGKKVQVILSR